MAQNIGEAQINLSVNTSQMEREVSAALKRLESKGFNLGSGINAKAFTQPLGRITGAANEFQKSLDASNARVIAFGASAGAIYNVQRAFTALIGSTIEVQKSLTDINVILNASNKTLGQFGDQLFQIARDTGQAFSTVATAAGELARQGLSVEQTLKRTNDALVLARLSGLDAASSVEALTASINSFNNSALDSAQIVNKLASVDAAFAVSSADLAEALKRVGSSAQDVGVNFDQLLAIVASVNQTTARGGAVIGNSLKTIFTRVQRTEVLDQLENLGIAVRDLQGNTAPAIQVLTGLAQKFDQLGSAQKSQVAELVGGVFQINILKAALGDLSKEYSVYGNALKIATNASDEAVRRNEELNKTLSALINRTVANLTKAGSEIGTLSFAPAIERVLGTINSALENFDVKGDSIGSKIGRGIFEGIGSFISGPGIALLIGVFIKIFGDLAKFTIEASKTILSLNKSSQSQAQIQERINNILAQNPQLVQNILNKQVSLLQVEKDILTVIQAQAQARQQSSAIAATITRGLVGRGITSEKGVITPRTKSQGFIPNFSANKEIMGAIAGGYMPGQVRSMSIPNYGRVTYNDAETVKKFSGLNQPGIMPPENSDAGKEYKKKFKDRYGINPYASKGFIPNFAATTNRLVSKGDIPLNSQDMYDILRRSSEFGNQVYGSSTGGYFLRSTANKDKALMYYKQQTEKAVLGKGKGILSKEEIEKTGAVLVYPAFGGGGLGSTTAKALKHSGKRSPDSPEFTFSTFGFPGPNGGLGAQLYEDVQKAIKGQVYNFIEKAALKPKDLIDDTRFDSYVNSNLNRSTIESAIGGIFEAGLKSAIFSAVDDPNAPLDLSGPELQKLAGTFKGAEPLSKFSVGEVKNALNPAQASSMADKIASTKGYPLKTAQKRKALGFIPNFSPLDKAFNTEKSLGGKPTLDYKEGIGLFVRDGKTQPNFGAVMRDHPEGMQKAIKNSQMIQGMTNSKGFIPNFAGIDPTSLLYLTTGFMGGQGSQSGLNLQLAEKKLGELLNARGEIEYQLLNASKLGLKNRRQLNNLEEQKAKLDQEIASQRASIRSETPIFARRGGQFVGGIGGVAGRFAGKYGAGLALAAPLLASTASQFVGDEYTREGRTQKAAVSGIGTIASFAGLGAAVGGGVPGAIVGGALGGIMATYDAIKEFKDIMPEVARSVEAATEKFNGITTSTQAISVALESMKTAQEGVGLSADTRSQLLVKANQDFAEGLSKLADVSKEKTNELISLYNKMGDTAEFRTKIGMLQSEAKKELDIETARLNLLKANQLFKEATDPNIFVKAGSYLTRFGTPDYKARFGSEPGGPKSTLNPLEQKQADAAARNLADNFYSILTNSISRREGAPAGSKFDLNLQDIQSLQNALNKEGLDGLKKTILGIAEIDSEAEYINFLLEGTDLNLLKSALEKLNFKIKTMDEITKARAEFEAKEAAGTSKITSQEQLSRLFNRGGIPQAALGNIDYEAIFGKTSTLQGQYNQLVGQEALKNLMDLNTELGNSPDKLKLLQQYTEEVAKVQDDLSKGIITTSQAFERLKTKVDSLTFDKLAKGMFSGERADLRQGQLQNLLKQGNFTEGFQPLLSFYDRLGDNAITTADKINKSFANLAENMQTGFEDAFGAFLDGTKTAEDAFRSFALNLSQQIIKEQFSIGFRSILGQFTGGGGAGTGYGGAGGGGILGNLLGSLFGGGKSQGGIIKKYSNGGHVQGGSGVRDDVPAMLTDGEYVLRKSAVNKYGIDALNMLNRGGMIKGYAGGGGITPGPGERTANSFINSLFSRGNDVSSYLRDPFLQANNRMSFRGGRGASLLSQPQDLVMRGPNGKLINYGPTVWSTPYFDQAAGYSRQSFGLRFKNIAGQTYYPRGNIPFTQASPMVQSYYGLENARMANHGGIRSIVTGQTEGVSLKNFFNAKVSDAVLNNLSPAQREEILTNWKTGGPEVNAYGGRKGRAFLVKSDYNRAVSMPPFLRKQIDKEIKYAKISDPGYMDKATRGNYLGTLRAKNLSRGMTGSATFLDDVKMAAQLQGMNQGAIPKSSTPVMTGLSETMASAAKTSLFSKGLDFAKGLGGGLFRGLAYAPATEFLNPSSLGPAQGTLPYMLEMGQISMQQFGNLSRIQQSDRAIWNVFNARSRGGRIKGYAGGGSVNFSLANAYDFFGPEGDRLTGAFSTDAFKTEVKGPEDLANVPALTGRFNISDFLTSRAMTNEENPMVALRDQRFLGMQNYQQQVSNFKTSYNEQMRQVEEMRRQEQERVNQINAANRAAYNQQRSQLLIGGLISAGTSLFGGLAGGGFLGKGGSQLAGLLGMGGGGGGGYSFLGDIFSRGLNFLQQGLTGGFSPNYATSTGTPALTEDQKKQLTKGVEAGQFRGGVQDSFFQQQAQLFPQFGGRGQTGIGYTPGAGFSLNPTSSFGGFQYNVGVGTPAGFQTQTQNLKDYYRVNFATPVAPVFPGRGNLMIATNPYDTRGSFYTNAFGGYGFAKGGLVKGYQMGGGIQDLPLPPNLTFKGSNGRTYKFSDLGITKYSDLTKAGQAFQGGYNNPELIHLLGDMQTSLGGQFNRVTAINDLYHMQNRAPGTSHRTGYKADFTLTDYKNGKENIINFLSSKGLKQGEDYLLTFEGPGTPGATGTHFDFQLRDKGVTKIAMAMSGASNIAGTNAPVVMAGMGLPSKQSFPLTAFSGPTNMVTNAVNTIGPQANPFANQKSAVTNFLTPTNKPAAIAKNAPFQFSDAVFNPPTMNAQPALVGGGKGMYRGPLMFSQEPPTKYTPATAPMAGPSRLDMPYRGGRGAKIGSLMKTPLDADLQEYTKSFSQLYNEAAQSSLMQLPFFQDIQTMVNRFFGGEPSLYQTVGSLLDTKNKGMYSNLANKFAPFYGGQKNRILSQPTGSNWGEKGFNNYLKYLGLNPFSTTLNQLNAFRGPMTPSTLGYNPFGFASRYFSGFGGFTSTGVPFSSSNYFGTGSRLGIQPDWVARATGGMIYGGTSYKDDVPAMLMGGEYVVRKDVVNRMGQPFFDKLNRGQINGFADGGPVGTSFPSIGIGNNDNQENSKVQFIEALMKLLKSLDQLNKNVETQTREAKNQTDNAVQTTDQVSTENGGGVVNNINISVNVDQNGKVSDNKSTESQETGQATNATDQDKFKKTLERSRALSEMLRQQILKVIVEEQRPGGVLYQGSKGRDLGR